MEHMNFVSGTIELEAFITTAIDYSNASKVHVRLLNTLPGQLVEPECHVGIDTDCIYFTSTVSGLWAYAVIEHLDKNVHMCTNDTEKKLKIMSSAKRIGLTLCLTVLLLLSIFLPMSLGPIANSIASFCMYVTVWILVDYYFNDSEKGK